MRLGVENWLSSYTHYRKWNEITCPFNNLNVCTVVVWKWISIFIPHTLQAILKWLYLKKSLTIEFYDSPMYYITCSKKHWTLTAFNTLIFVKGDFKPTKIILLPAFLALLSWCPNKIATNWMNKSLVSIGKNLTFVITINIELNNHGSPYF